MQRLHGVGVLVTRPEQQSAPLCRLLESHGARVWPLPVIEIRAISVGQDAGKSAQGFDLIVFTSVNAVRYGAALLSEHRHVEVGAIGPATAGALRQAGFAVAIEPAQSADSEALLAHPGLEELRNRRVLLVKGRGGRRLLAQELARRGAQVVSAEVYERAPVEPSAPALDRIQVHVQAGDIHVVTATSAEIGVHLLRIAPPELRVAFDTLHWLVPTQRVSEALRVHGLDAPFLIAGSAGDQESVSALLSWRSAAGDA